MREDCSAPMAGIVSLTTDSILAKGFAAGGANGKMLL